MLVLFTTLVFGCCFSCYSDVVFLWRSVSSRVCWGIVVSVTDVGRMFLLPCGSMCWMKCHNNHVPVMKFCHLIPFLLCNCVCAAS